MKTDTQIVEAIRDTMFAVDLDVLLDALQEGDMVALQAICDYAEETGNSELLEVARKPLFLSNDKFFQCARKAHEIRKHLNGPDFRYEEKCEYLESGSWTEDIYIEHGTFIEPDGWPIGGSLRESEWSRARFRLECHNGVINDVPVNITVSGTMFRIHRGSRALRVRIEFVQDGEPSVFHRGWMVVS